MRKTTNYQLNMPDGTDTVDIEILNANAAAIDAALKGLSDEKEAKLSGAAAKTTLADADALPLLDSAASSATKRITFANLITAMKAKLDTLEPYVDSAAGKVTFYCKQTAKPSAAMSVGIEVIR